MTPRRRVSPSTREDVLQTLRDGLEQAPGKAQAVGSRTSKSACFVTSGIELSLEYFRDIERIGPTRVRVGAGVVLADLLQALRGFGLALPTIGEWGGQTIAGAISSGTHGGSYVYGSLCSSVHQVTLMDGNGALHTFQRDTQEYHHVLPSFGTTGVGLEYELDCEPAFALSLGRSSAQLPDFIDTLLHNPQRVEFRSAIWIPALGNVVDYAARRIPGLPVGAAVSREARFSPQATVLDWVARKVASRSRGLYASRLGAQVLFPYRHYTGPYDTMLAPLKGTADHILRKRQRNRTPPEGEFAIRSDRAKAFILELERLFQRLGTYPDRPIGLRPGIEERGSLCATQDGPSVWVSMFLYPNNRIMDALPALLRAYEARPHWGKCVFHHPQDVSTLYPNWDAFCSFRSELDPAGLFVSPFAQSFGIEA